MILLVMPSSSRYGSHEVFNKRLMLWAQKNNSGLWDLIVNTVQPIYSVQDVRNHTFRRKVWGTDEHGRDKIVKVVIGISDEFPIKEVVTLAEQLPDFEIYVISGGQAKDVPLMDNLYSISLG